MECVCACMCALFESDSIFWSSKQCFFWISSWSSPAGCSAALQLPLDYTAPIYCLVHGLAPSPSQCMPASANTVCKSSALKQPLCLLPLMLLYKHCTSAPYSCPRHPLCASVCRNRWHTQWASPRRDTAGEVHPGRGRDSRCPVA